jgi:hypothetical protein
MIGASLTGTVMVRSPQNRRFPKLNKNYDYVQFPSLLPGRPQCELEVRLHRGRRHALKMAETRATNDNAATYF